ncbi:MAG: YheT family hydrolase [Pirellula sp.]
MNSNWTENNDFIPPWYLKSGHLQTLLTGFYKPKVAITPDVTHKIPIGNLGEMLVHENSPGNLFGDDKAVFLLHGLGSCHRGTYMSRIAANLLASGFRVFRFDLPGAGDSYLHTPLPPHGACYELVWQSLLFLSEKCGIRRWRGAGVSLGGNILLKLTSAHADDLTDSNNAPFCIDRSVAVAPPIDLSACCQNMERGFNAIYAKYFLRSLKRQTLSRAKLWPQWRDVLPGASFKTIREFDNTVTSVLAGFHSAEHYYEFGSSKNDLSKIVTKTWLLLDKDDPIVPISIFEDAPYSSSTTVVTTKKGGHVGYLARIDQARASQLERDVSKKKHFRWADEWISQQLIEDF